MRRHTGITLALFAAVGMAWRACGFQEIDHARVAEIAKMLPERPGIPGAHISNRAAWDRLASTGEGRYLIRKAVHETKEPIAECTDALYLEFSTPGNGNRTHYQKPFFRRETVLNHLVLAECLENKGQFIPRIADYLRTLCSERTWCMPAHDRQLKAFKGEEQNVDLGAQSRAFTCAFTVCVLRGRLPEDVERLTLSELERRIFAPLRERFTKAKSGRDCGPMWWIQGPANWTAVCHSGVTRAALAVLEGREDRAVFIEAAERSAKTFMTGFTEDGYCSEGMGYWNYGWGHFLTLTLAVREATGGKVDLCGTPKARKVMEFGTGALLFGETAPAFADGGGALSGLILKLGHLIWPDLPVTQGALSHRPLEGGIGYAFLMDFGQWDGTPAPVATAYPIRTGFPDAQMWVLRNGTSDMPFLMALKGGHNKEFHNHNDVGSYTLYLGETWVGGDAGGTEYNAKTFSDKRYEIPMINSYGHPLPVLNGTLQSDGRKFAAKVIKTDFSDGKDVISMELAGAYDRAKSKANSLVRTFTYDRQAKSVAVSDAVAFDGDGSFSVAVITCGTLEKAADDNYILTVGEDAAKQRIAVEIQTGGIPFEMSAERIENENRISPNRYAITLSNQVKAATVSITYRKP